jgi:hypothetical protein
VDAAAPAPKKRGRPRKDTASVPLVDKDLPLEWFSLTVGKLKAHVLPVWLVIIYTFFLTYAVAGSFSLERGGKEDWLHVQAIIALHMMGDDSSIKRMKTALKLALGVRWGDGSGMLAKVPTSTCMFFNRVKRLSSCSATSLRTWARRTLRTKRSAT